MKESFQDFFNNDFETLMKKLKIIHIHLFCSGIIPPLYGALHNTSGLVNSVFWYHHMHIQLCKLFTVCIKGKKTMNLFTMDRL